MGGSNGIHVKEVCTGCRWGNLKENDHLGDIGVDGRARTVLLRLGYRYVFGFVECRSDIVSSIKCGELLDQW